MNSRLDALQAAILRVKVPHLKTWAAGRQRNANRYGELFAQYGLNSQVKTPSVQVGYVHVYNQFTIRVKERDALQQYLSRNGIPTEIYYPYPLHLQQAFATLGYRSGDCPQSEAASEEVVSLPIYPELNDKQLETVVQNIAEFYTSRT